MVAASDCKLFRLPSHPRKFVSCVSLSPQRPTTSTFVVVHSSKESMPLPQAIWCKQEKELVSADHLLVRLWKGSDLVLMLLHLTTAVLALRKPRRMWRASTGMFYVCSVVPVTETDTGV